MSKKLFFAIFLLLSFFLGIFSVKSKIAYAACDTNPVFSIYSTSSGATSVTWTLRLRRTDIDTACTSTRTFNLKYVLDPNTPKPDGWNVYFTDTNNNKITSISIGKGSGQLIKFHVSRPTTLTESGTYYHKAIAANSSGTLHTSITLKYIVTISSTATSNTSTTTSTNLQTDQSTCTKGNKSSCGGVYGLHNPTGLNFGDYNCEVAQNGAFAYKVVNNALMNDLEAYGKTKDYCRWRCIMGYESDYNPNNWTNNGSADGAWGLLQMEADACISPTRGTTGNVIWSQQIKNGLKRNYNVLGGSFAYWSVYKNNNICSHEPDWNSTTQCACSAEKPGCRN